MNVLESAGFSRSNPYYIVKQGKVRNAQLVLWLSIIIIRLNHNIQLGCVIACYCLMHCICVPQTKYLRQVSHISMPLSASSVIRYFTIYLCHKGKLCVCTLSHN